MKLQPEPFEAIKKGTKLIESRLYDEKRREIKLGEVIEFQKQLDLIEVIKTEVVGLLRYKTFSDLIFDLPAKYFGWNKSQKAIDEIYKFYSKDQENQYTVIGIKIKLLQSA